MRASIVIWLAFLLVMASPALHAGDDVVMQALDDELVREAAELTGIRTKKDLVHEALRVLVAARKRRSLLELRGKIRFAAGYDHRKARRRRGDA